MEWLPPTAWLDTPGLVLFSHLPCHHCHHSAKPVLASKWHRAAPRQPFLLLLAQADSMNRAVSGITFPWVLSLHLPSLLIPSLQWDDVLMLF